MALADEVQARYPSTRLIQLTNPGDEAASTVDTTLLGYAATDAAAEFEEIAGVAYDNGEDNHVRAAVKGVIAYLYKWGEAPGTASDRAMEEFQEACESVSKITGRNRIRPSTNAVADPSSEQQGTEKVLPDTDREFYEDLIPDAPK